ncbi:hypothetical protein FACS1894137_15480 [Spirochaetia bacterium]|nr:hypothetical protein FACS1894137_15480 [Spirochaetia bacterium]
MPKKIIFLGEFQKNSAASIHVDLEIAALRYCSNGDYCCVKLNLNHKYSYKLIIPIIIRLFKSLQLFYRLLPADIAVIYGFSSFTVIDIFLLKLWGCFIVFERTEYPYSLIMDSSRISKIQYEIIKKNDKYSLRWLKYADGFLTCSNALENYYKKFTLYKTPYLKCPLYVDYDKFSLNNEKYTNEFSYIAYCGDMGNNKDGVGDLIEAFKCIAPLYKINLMLIGSAKDYIMTKLKNQAKEFGERIIFTGIVNHDEMPKLLASASILASACPNNKQNEGSFPSKVGEYLSTGIPVIVTNVGDIALYIKDGINGFIAEPNNIESFAGKIKYVLDNYEHALQVGKTAQELAKKFDYKQVGPVLRNFLLNIKK